MGVKNVKLKKASVRLDSCDAGAVSIANHFQSLAEEVFRERYRVVISRNSFSFVVTLVGIEVVETSSLLGGRSCEPVLVAYADMGGLRTTFEISLYGTGFVSRSEEYV